MLLKVQLRSRLFLMKGSAPSFESREIITAAMSYQKTLDASFNTRLHPTDEVVIPRVVVEVSHGSPAAAVSSHFRRFQSLMTICRRIW